MPATEGRRGQPDAPGLIVEFLGLPGSGKSTLAWRVGEILAARGVPVAQATYPLAHRSGRIGLMRRKLRVVLHALAADPAYVWGIARAVRRSHQRRRVDAALLVLNACAVAGAIQRVRSRSSICLVDQGMCQVAWSILLGARRPCPEDVIAATLAASGRLTVIALAAGGPTIARRLAARDRRQSRLERRAGEASYSPARAQIVLDGVLAALARGPHAVQTFVVDNNADAGQEAVAHRIAARLERHAGAPRETSVTTGAPDAGAPVEA